VQLAAAGDDTAVVYSRSVFRDVDTGVERDFHERAGFDRLPTGRCVDDIIRQNFVPLLTALVRREWLESVGGFRHPPGQEYHAEDYELWMRLALSGATFTAVDEQLAVYTWHSGNRSRDIDRDRFHVVLLRNLTDEYPEHREALVRRRRQAQWRTGIRQLAATRRSWRAGRFGDAVRGTPYGVVNAVQGYQRGDISALLTRRQESRRS
jgi:hypothetical protein